MLPSETDQLAHVDVEQWSGRRSVLLPADARQFLETHRFLLPLLDEAETALPRYFGPDALLSYALFHDPEDGVTSKLTLSVSPTSAPEDAAEQYRRFTRDWWVPRLARACGVLIIMAEYQ